MLVQEVDVRKAPSLDEVVGAVRQRVAETHEVQLHALVLIEPGSIFKTSSGKIQRRATREAFLSGQLREVSAWKDSGAGSEPVTVVATEVREAEVPSVPTTVEELEAWLRIHVAERARVRLEEVERDVPVTRYGLDSLGAVELAHDVERTLGVVLPLEVLLQGPTLSELALQVMARRSGSQALAPISRRPEGAELLVAPAQQRLWFLHHLDPASAVYNIPAAVRLRGGLDVGALERGLREIVHRHEALRTTLVTVDGAPRQVIAPEGQLSLELVDLSGTLPAEREIEARRWMDARASQPFDLARGPLLRAGLVRLGEDEHVLMVVVHHIVSDGWSMGVLVRELAALYGAFRSGQGSSAGGAARAVRGLRAVAPLLAGGGRAGGPARVVEAAARRGVACAGPAHRQAPAFHPELPGREAARDAASRAGRAAEGARSAGGGHPLHDAAGRLPDAAAALVGSGGRERGLGHRRALAARGGGPHRPLRQHARAEDGPVRLPELPRAAGPGEADHAGCLRPRGRALREARGGAAAGARFEPEPALPGDARAAERAGRDARHAGPGDAPGGHAHRHGDVRPAPVVHRGARGPRGRARVQHRPVRRGHRGSDDGPAPHAAGGRRRPPGAALA